MVLLEQYKQEREHHDAFRYKPQLQIPKEYGFLIRLVMRLSGGRIRELKQASVALVIAATVIFIISIIVFTWTSSGRSAPTAPLDVDQRQFQSTK